MADEGPQQATADDDLLDLLVKQVTERLSAGEQRALDALDGPAASAYRRDFERAAAAMALAGSAAAAPLPAALRERLAQQAQTFIDAAGGPVRTDNRVVELASRRSESRARTGGFSGWWAAAACLLLAISAWFRTSPAPPAHVAAIPTPAAARLALLSHTDAIKVPLGATKDPAAGGVRGDVVWDSAAQRGYIRFVGLPHNDPAAHQYQIWIFDGERDQRYPVDGGVFNSPSASGEVIVPIHASVPVRVAKAFAITLEKPGGVVVSTRDHVVALAQVG